MREDDTLAYSVHCNDHGVTSRALSAIIIAEIVIDVHTLYSIQCMVHKYSVQCTYTHL